MNRASFLALSVGLASLAVLIPVGLSGYLAYVDIQRRETAQLEAYTDNVLARVRAVTSQAEDALRDMEHLSGRECSAAYLADLRRVVFAHRQVSDAGMYGDGKYLCSALLGGAAREDIELPASDLRTANGLSIWFDMGNPFGVDRESLLLGRGGNYVSIDPAAYVNVVDMSDRAVAAVNAANGRIFAMSGPGNADRMEAVWRAGGKGGSPQWMYAVRKPAGEPFGVVVASQRADLIAKWGVRFSLWIVIGLLVGAGLCWLSLQMLMRQVSMQGELQAGLRRREFVLHYQPIVSLASRRCVGVEALIRWKQRGRFVPPDNFIPAAEEAGLLEPLTDYALAQACRELRPYLIGHRDFYVSINVGASDLKTDRFLRIVSDMVARTGVQPAQLCIEATERGFLDVGDARDIIQAFREAGHPVYIDDFGTGYSNLAYLQKFKVDALKIDKSFIDALGREAVSSSVAPHIVAMAQSLGMAVVAEGVETEEQAAQLRELGAQYGQGWLFAKAMPVEDLMAYLRASIGAKPQSSAAAGPKNS